MGADGAVHEIILHLRFLQFGEQGIAGVIHRVFLTSLDKTQQHGEKVLGN